MLQILLYTLLINNVMSDVFSPPSCLNNYTTFMDQTMNYSNSSLIKNYTSITGSDCANNCNKNLNCTSFNYHPTISNKNLQSRCELLNSHFNSSLLNNRFDSAYYLKSYNDCSSQHKMLIALYVTIVLIVVLILGCCFCGWFRRRRPDYNSL